VPTVKEEVVLKRESVTIGWGVKFHQGMNGTHVISGYVEGSAAQLLKRHCGSILLAINGTPVTNVAGDEVLNFFKKSGLQVTLTLVSRRCMLFHFHLFLWGFDTFRFTLKSIKILIEFRVTLVFYQQIEGFFNRVKVNLRVAINSENHRWINDFPDIVE